MTLKLEDCLLLPTTLDLLDELTRDGWKDADSVAKAGPACNESSDCVFCGHSCNALEVHNPSCPWTKTRKLLASHQDRTITYFSSAQLKTAALKAMRTLAEEEPPGWFRDQQLAALEQAEAGLLDEHWPKSEASIRTFIAALAEAKGA